MLARYQSRQLVNWIERLLEGRFRLTINREKTRIVKMRQPGESLSFLRFTLRYDRDQFGRDHRYLNVIPSAKALARAREKIRDMTGPQRCCVPIPQLIQEINRWMMSWSRYYRYGYPRSVFRQLNWYVGLRLSRHLQRRSQCPFRPELENFLDFLLVFRLSEVSGSSFRRTWVTCECFAVPASARP
ncbi:MAG: group II intron maturase-specific domain-containing protein, partial [Isosphaeraceae bacterium]